MRFSQKAGFKPASKIAQRDSIDDELRASLWSVLSVFYWDTYEAPRSGSYNRSDYIKDSNMHGLVFSLWLNYFKYPTDTINTYWADCLKSLRGYFFEAEWFEVYDFVEFVAANGLEKHRKSFAKAANSFLERENSAYRFVDGQIVEITSAEEIEEVERALSVGEKFVGARTHLQSALALLADRKAPDFRNSIKESISAVESVALKLSEDGSGTLGVILREMERAKKLHPALKSAFSSLYGYTSDADGIRHALLDEHNLTKADARFMLVCCSAFINYVLDNASE